MNVAEEFQDLLDSTAWASILNLIAEDIGPRRLSLLTSLTISETKRISEVSRLATYKDFLTSIYEKAGRNVPPKIISLLTGELYDTRTPVRGL